jgi:uncharacterized DUF497 family protein
VAARWLEVGVGNSGELFLAESDTRPGDKCHSVYVGRRLFVVFTIRRKLIRVISVRDMNQNEMETYERYEAKNS